MTISFSVWSAIGWTIEIILILVLLLFVRLWQRAFASIRKMTEDQTRAERLAREKFGHREG